MIIRTQNDIAGADTATLVATYNALTGKSIKKFENRAIAESRTSMAILAAQNASGHLGVPKHKRPEALTAEERAQRGERGNPLAEETDAGPQDGQPLGADASGEQPSQPAEEKPAAAPSGQNPYKPGTMAHSLWVATSSVERHKAQERKPASGPRPSKTTFTAVRATTTGTSKLQAASARTAVFRWIQAQKADAVTLEACIAAHGPGARGHIQKLLEKGHLEIAG